MVRRNDVPSFGPLSGWKVAVLAVSVAGPFAGEMFAELGADVVWIENPKGPDVMRTGKARGMDINRRNLRDLVLDIPSEKGSEVFSRLLEDVDIFIEASKPGQMAKWGWTDQKMWEANPSLVVAHISAFGQTGSPKYQGRPGYEPMVEAFTGMMAMNAGPGAPASPLFPYVADYYVAMYTAFACLAAAVKARETGTGESMDVAQYEIVTRTLAEYGMEAWNDGIHLPREWIHNRNDAGYNSFECSDGESLMVLAVGVGVIKAAAKLFDLEYGGDLIPQGTSVLKMDQPGGRALFNGITGFCRRHTAAEAEEIMYGAGVPCSRVMEPEDLPGNEQFIARRTFISYPNFRGEELIAPASVPRLANNPGQVWRGGPRMGEDTLDVLRDLGYSEKECQQLVEDSAVRAATDS